MSYKKCKVVMVATAKEPYKMPYSDNIPRSNLILGLQDSFRYNKRLYYAETETIGNYSKQMFQNLYILSDDEIKEGDWVYSGIPDCIHKFTKLDRPDEYISKIIATTNTSLAFTEGQKHWRQLPPHERIPQPSQSFIEKYITEYNKGNKIEEVMVEYELYKDNPIYSFDAAKLHGYSKYSDKYLKISSDNTITIKKVKNSYSREEVTSLFMEFRKHAYHKQYVHEDYVEKWLTKNL